MSEEMPDRMKDYLDGKITTTSGRTPENFTPGAPEGIDPTTGQHKSYWVLSASERAKGFLRPVRRKYKHINCGTITTMGVALAETYAADPKFYGATMCVNCNAHRPVGEDGEFFWVDDNGQVTTEKVGT